MDSQVVHFVLLLRLAVAMGRVTLLMGFANVMLGFRLLTVIHVFKIIIIIRVVFIVRQMQLAVAMATALLRGFAHVLVLILAQAVTSVILVMLHLPVHLVAGEQPTLAVNLWVVVVVRVAFPAPELAHAIPLLLAQTARILELPR